jgi:hypothetical protein
MKTFECLVNLIVNLVIYITLLANLHLFVLYSILSYFFRNLSLSSLRCLTSSLSYSISQQYVNVTKTIHKTLRIAHVPKPAAE